jgi:hypothetical protein
MFLLKFSIILQIYIKIFKQTLSFSKKIKETQNSCHQVMLCRPKATDLSLTTPHLLAYKGAPSVA